MSSSWKSVLLAGAFAIPVGSPDSWEVLNYSKIPGHKTEFSKEGMKIQVRSSSGPIIYPLPSPLVVTGVELKGRIKGELKFAGKKQGEKGADDFLLRVGLVVKGDQTLGFLKRAVAPDWVKRLFALAPKGMGVDRIEFLNVVSQEQLLGQQRRHPLSELLRENYIWKAGKDGELDLSHDFKAPVTAVAVWLASDGDDAKSDFDVVIRELKLKTR